MIELLFVAWATVAGEWPDNMPESTMQWFKAQTVKGAFCCSVADGHPADWDRKDGHYKVFIQDEWRDVPDDVVILKSGNPTGRAVVWLTTTGGIRCFVPGPEG